MMSLGRRYGRGAQFVGASRDECCLAPEKSRASLWILDIAGGPVENRQRLAAPSADLREQRKPFNAPGRFRNDDRGIGARNTNRSN
jgi:hypothetical protein